MSTLAEFMILSGADNRPPIEKIQADCDLKATNITLQGLPSDIYSLVNHHRVAKDLWERVQLLIQGTSLTKLERECKLYDAFDKFAHIKGESLHKYYLRFTQLINDMNIYKMKLEQFQVNTKFLNSLLPEWSTFVTAVKLIKDLHTTNFDQLHAYLQQHELHANEVRLMRERNQDPLALIDSGLAVPMFKQGDDPIDAINIMMSFLSTVVTSRFPSTNNQLRNSSNPRQQATIHDGRVTWQDSAHNPKGKEMLRDPGIAEGPVTQSVITHNTTYQADDLDAYDSDCDEISTAKAILMANLSSYDLDYLLETQNAAVQDTNSSAQQDAMILSVFEQLSHQVTNYNKVNKDNLIANESLSVELERYKERKKEAKNIDNEIALEKKVKELDNIVYKIEETLMLKEESRSEMLLKQSDPMVLEKKVNIKQVNYAVLNQLSEDFGKRFVPQQELSAEQAFWFQMSNPSTDSSDASPVKVDGSSGTS
ncbi:hypothetical protein Tco_0747901 [Tanacetum coccineum]|uniref:Integrase, catalytic region, zinc finger, CCHC-type, peptidase aspartic, catalytic n=1 Tax=Tanacetum coccineum TaxID=301880 RepID=A0ABQ4YUB7_9ASTR